MHLPWKWLQLPAYLNAAEGAGDHDHLTVTWEKPAHGYRWCAWEEGKIIIIVMSPYGLQSPFRLFFLV